MFRKSKTAIPTKGAIVAAILFTFFTVYANTAPAQQKPNDEDSMKYPRNWHNNDWVKFFSSTVQIAAGELYGAAGAAVNPVYGGKIPLLDVYSAISAMADSTKAGLQVWLRRKATDAASAEDWKNADRYEAIYDCLNGDCAQMKELTKATASKAPAANTADLIFEVKNAETDKPVPSAKVRIEPIPATGEAFGDVTDENGETMKLPIPIETARNGLRSKVTATGFTEKWTDISSDQLQGGERRITVYLKSNRIPDVSGVWKADYAYVVRTISQDGKKISWTADYMYGPTKIHESAEGTVSETSAGSASVQVTITYTTATEPTRKGTFTGSVSVDSNGKATKFSWSNGDRYVRGAGK